MERHVVVKLKIPIVAEREQSGIAHGGELAAEGNLRIPHIQRIRGDALQSGQAGEIVPGVGTCLPSRDGEKPEAGFVQKIGD